MAENGESRDMMEEAVSALQRGDEAGALTILNEAIQTADRQVMLQATHLKAFLLTESDPEEAKRCFREAIESGDPAVAPQSNMNLGLLLAKEGDFDGAKQSLIAAIESGDPGFAPESAYNLGIVCRDFGDVEGAERYLQQAVETASPSTAAEARAVLKKLARRNRPGLFGRLRGGSRG